MKPGAYWYRGPYFRDGKQRTVEDGQWRIVSIGDGHFGGPQHLCYLGNDWDGDATDIEAMEKTGEFVFIEPPADGAAEPKTAPGTSP